MCNSFLPHGLQHSRLLCPSHLPEFAQTHVHWVSNAIQPSHPLPPLLLLLLLSFSQHQGLFQWVGSLHQLPEVWSFSFSISPSNGYSGLIFFRIDLFGLHVVHRTLKNLLQHHNSKASILWCSTFFIVQLSHPYMTAGRTIALTVRAFVGKEMSLLFNMLFVIAFLPRSKHLLNFMAAVTIVCSDFGTQENKMLLLLFFPLLFAIADIIMKKFEILGELPKCDTEMK